jgi:hypothetical protein
VGKGSTALGVLSSPLLPFGFLPGQSFGLDPFALSLFEGLKFLLILCPDDAEIQEMLSPVVGNVNTKYL